MAGREREFLEMLPPRDHGHRYMESDNSMKDFWRNTSDRESLQGMREARGRDGQAVVDIRDHHLSQSAYSYGGGHLQQDTSENVVTMAARSNLGSVHHEATFYADYQQYQHHLDSSATATALLPTYTNFFNASCVDNHGLKPEPDMPSPGMNGYNHGEGRYFASTLVPQMAIPIMSHDVFSVTMASESIHRDHDMDYLRRELAYKCPRSSDLLMAITSTAETTVREHGSAISGVSSDDDDDDDAPDETARLHHTPYLFWEGWCAERASQQARRGDEEVPPVPGGKHDEDWRRSVTGLLHEEPFSKFMQFKDATTKRLENIVT